MSARNLDQAAIPISLANANAYVNSKIILSSKIELRHQITLLNNTRMTATTVPRLRMKHHEHTWISTGGIKIYKNAGNYTDVQFSAHIYQDGNEIRGTCNI